MKRHLIYDILNEPTQKKQKMEIRTHDSNIITLNIGGMKFQTTLSTIRNHQNSVLFKMFEDRYNTEPNIDGSYFIDRDGTHFRYILNYLRDNKLNALPNKNTIPELLAEAEYYNIIGLVNILGSYNFTSNIVNIREENILKQCTNTTHWKKIHEYNASKYIREDSFRQIYLASVGTKPLLMLFNLEEMKNKIFGAYLNKTTANSFMFQVKRQDNNKSKIAMHAIRDPHIDSGSFQFHSKLAFKDCDISEKHKIDEIEISEPDLVDAIYANFCDWICEEETGIEDVNNTTGYDIFSCECYQVLQ